MECLVIILNARGVDTPDTAAGVSDESRRYFANGGDGGFETAFTFLTQPLGVGTKAKKPDGDPIVLWRKYPDDWVFARKPIVGPPRPLLSSSSARPPVSELASALEADGAGNLLDGLAAATSDLFSSANKKG